MPRDPSDSSGLPARLSILQALGLATPGYAEWSHLRGLQHAHLRERLTVRVLIQLVAMALALAIAGGAVAWWQLAAWSSAGLGAIFHSMRRDRELARTRQSAVTRKAICLHTLGLGGIAFVWAVPLLLPQYLGNATVHLGIWALTGVLATGLALTTRAAPLAALLFITITGAASIAGFVLDGQWSLAGVALVFLAVALYGTLDSGRSYLVARLAKAALADKEKLVSLLLREFEEHDADWLWQIDTGRRVRAVSPRFAYALGQQPEDIEGRSFLELAAGEAWASGCFAPSLHELADQLKHRRSFSDLLVQVDVGGQDRWWKLSGAPLTDESGRFAGYRGVGSDVTARHLAEQRIAYLARHDTLTGLPNRSIVTQGLQDAFRAIERRGGRCALLLVDLDRFKAVNDTLGHPVGDKLLVQVAARLRDAVGQRGLCGRLGGDEFAVVVPDAHVTHVDALARRMIEHISKPYEVEDHQISIGASVGSAEGPRDGTLIEALMRHADLALYQAKRGGRGVHCRYQPELQAHTEERRQMEQALQHAVARDELHLVFQPIVEAGAEQLDGFEALLRWESDEHGRQGPQRCIPLAEASRQIVPIGEWVLHEACRQAVRWPAPLRVAINLSAAQLLEPAFAAKVNRALTDSGLSAHRLELELKESALPADAGTILEALDELRQLGCAIVLDNFGTGTSSLNQLGRFRFSSVKMDASLVRGATNGRAEEQAIVRAVVAMGDSIGMITTAEGVESAEEALLMRQLGCGRLQGFYYGRPMADAEALALAWRRASASAEQVVQITPAGQSAAA